MLKNINLLTVLCIFQFINLCFIVYTKPDISSIDIDIIWLINFNSNFIIFVILCCSDFIYDKVK